MPGLLGAIAGNEVFREPNVLSGGIARLCPFGAFNDVLFGGGGETGGVDQENVAAGEALLDDRDRFAAACEGRTLEDAVEAEPFAQGSPPSMSVPPEEEPCCPPRTSAAKSASPAPFAVSRPFVALGPPKLMNSLRVVAVALLAPSSWSLRVCSCSTRADIDLMSVI
jgi:hypothetical protein